MKKSMCGIINENAVSNLNNYRCYSEKKALTYEARQ